MPDQLQGQKIAILAADGVERVELEQPRGALHAAGATTELLSIHPGQIRAVQSDIQPAGTFDVDKEVSEADVGEYDALLLPGGVSNPDRLRRDPAAVKFVKEFAGTGRPIAAICHAPWTLIEADVVAGVRLTSYPSLRTDLRNAGAEVTNTEVVVDQQYITSRSPADLPAFCSTMVDQFTKVPEAVSARQRQS